MKYYKLIIFISCITLISCESDQERVDRIESELDKVILEENSKTINPDGIVDSLNFFKNNWIEGTMWTRNKETGFSGPWYKVSFNRLDIYTYSEVDLKQLINRRWETEFSWAIFYVSDFVADSIIIDDETIPAIKAFRGFYQHAIEKIKEDSEINSGLDFYNKYFKDKGSESKGFYMYITEERRNKYFLNLRFDPGSTSDFDRQIDAKEEITGEQYEFFLSTYQSLLK